MDLSEKSRTAKAPAKSRKLPVPCHPSGPPPAATTTNPNAVRRSRPGDAFGKEYDLMPAGGTDTRSERRRDRTGRCSTPPECIGAPTSVNPLTSLFLATSPRTIQSRHKVCSDP